MPKFFLFFLFLIILLTFVSGNSYNWVRSDNNIYAEVWGINIGNILIPSAGTYYPVKNLSIGEFNGFEVNSDNITVLYTGVYKLNSHWSFSGSANNEYHISINVNGVQQDKCHAERKLGNTGDVGSSGFTCLYTFYLNDIIEISIENTEDENPATIESLNFNIIKISN